MLVFLHKFMIFRILQQFDRKTSFAWYMYVHICTYSLIANGEMSRDGWAVFTIVCYSCEMVCDFEKLQSERSPIQLMISQNNIHINVKVSHRAATTMSTMYAHDQNDLLTCFNAPRGFQDATSSRAVPCETHHVTHGHPENHMMCALSSFPPTVTRRSQSSECRSLAEDVAEDAEHTSPSCTSWWMRWCSALVQRRLVCCNLVEEPCDDAKLPIRKASRNELSL